MIVGVSDEGPDLLEKFIGDFKVAFPIAQSSDAARAYSLRGYPTYVLIGADGNLIGNAGHRVPSREVIEAALRDVVLLPEPVTSRVAPVAKSMNKRRFAETKTKLAQLAKLPLSQDEADYVQMVRGKLDEAIITASSRIRELANGPDFYRARERLKRIAKQFDRLPPGVEADAELKRFRKDERIQREIKAMRQLTAVRKANPLTKRSSRKKLIPLLDRIARKYPGSHAAAEASELRGKLAR